MPLVLPVGVANTRLVWTVAGSVEEMGFSVATAQTPEVTAAQIAERMRDAWIGTTIGSSAQWNDEFTFVKTSTTLMTVSGPVLAEATALDVGTNSEDAPPINCTILIKKLTDSGGRKNRGRLNIPSGKVEEAGVSAAGFILPATVTALQNQCDEWFAEMVTLEEQPVLLHSDPADEPTIITGFQVSSQIATQRRRMR